MKHDESLLVEKNPNSRQRSSIPRAKLTCYVRTVHIPTVYQEPLIVNE